MTTLSIRNSIDRSPVRRGLLLTGVVLSFGLLALAPAAQAVCQEGCLGSFNVALGDEALVANTTGTDNTAVGGNALLQNTTGSFNTVIGSTAMWHNTNGADNTAIGYYALHFNDSGADNTATGDSALLSNTTGSRNVATGFQALYNNSTGIDNTATGMNALFYNRGNYNTADGYKALENNTTGTNNTATGLNALNKNTTASSNTAHGAYALYNNINGPNNTANGLQALYSNTSGSGNTACGHDALLNNTTGASNIALGYLAGSTLTTGSNNIDIGNSGVVGESAKIRIGKTGTQTNTYIAGISGVTVAGGVGVVIDTNGQLGTVTSSARFKDNIQPMDKASEAILALRPVTFRYKKQLDPKATPQFGLIAEEVAKVDPDLVVADEQGKPFTVRYEEVNAMLLNEFLKEHRKVEALEKAMAVQQKENAAIRATLKEQAAVIQKVSAELAVTQPKMGLLANQ